MLRLAQDHRVVAESSAPGPVQGGMELHLRSRRLQLNTHAESGNSNDLSQNRRVSSGQKTNLLDISVGVQGSSRSHKISNWAQDLSRIIVFPHPAKGKGRAHTHRPD